MNEPRITSEKLIESLVQLAGIYRVHGVPGLEVMALPPIQLLGVAVLLLKILTKAGEGLLDGICILENMIISGGKVGPELLEQELVLATYRHIATGMPTAELRDLLLEQLIARDR